MDRLTDDKWIAITSYVGFQLLSALLSMSQHIVTEPVCKLKHGETDGITGKIKRMDATLIGQSNQHVRISRRRFNNLTLSLF